jgi:hypothetical protein
MGENITHKYEGDWRVLLIEETSIIGCFITMLALSKKH